MSPLVREPADAFRVGEPSIDARPTVSVIIPVYNGERYLADAIRSVLAQTVLPAEVIVVDDGSTDTSASIAEQFAITHPILRVLRRENGGPGVARNIGIAAASGEFLTFHDADDVMLEDRIALQLGYLLEHPRTSAVFGSVELLFEAVVDVNAQWVRHERAIQANTDGFNLMTMTVRAAAFAEVGGFDPSYRLAEDYNWIVRALAADHTVAAVPAVVTQRRIHDHNASKAHDDAQREVFRTLAEHIRALRSR